jgi:hypothetical protein
MASRILQRGLYKSYGSGRLLTQLVFGLVGTTQRFRPIHGHLYLTCKSSCFVLLEEEGKKKKKY